MYEIQVTIYREGQIYAQAPTHNEAVEIKNGYVKRLTASKNKPIFLISITNLETDEYRIAYNSQKQINFDQQGNTDQSLVAPHNFE